MYRNKRSFDVNRNTELIELNSIITAIYYLTTNSEGIDINNDENNHELTINMTDFFDKLKQKDYYSDLTIEEIRSICTFGDVFYHDLTQKDIIWGDRLINK